MIILDCSLISAAILNMLELQSENIPHPPPQNLNERHDHYQNVWQETSAFCHERRYT